MGTARFTQVKDSGARQEFETGMVRDTQEGKPRFDLLLPLGLPFHEQFLTRCAMHLANGAKKYKARNWEQARTQEELERYQASAFRHLVQWLNGETDEDHAAAVFFNLMGAEKVKWHLANPDRQEWPWQSQWNAPCEVQALDSHDEGQAT